MKFKIRYTNSNVFTQTREAEDVYQAVKELKDQYNYPILILSVEEIKENETKTAKI